MQNSRTVCLSHKQWAVILDAVKHLLGTRHCVRWEDCRNNILEMRENMSSIHLYFSMAAEGSRGWSESCF